jgi:iron(III) transport system substrate-binding protein
MKQRGSPFAAGAIALFGAFALRLATAPVLAAPADDAAKQEGVVVWYGTMNTKDMNATAAAFMNGHPGIKVDTLRLGSSQLPARITTEQRAGKYNADIISGDGFQVFQLLEAGAFDKYAPPDTGKFIKGTVDPNGFWTNLYQNTTVIAWNPERLKADHLKPPTSVADFAKPEWRGKFGFDTGALNWFMGVLQAQKDGAELAGKIAANAPVKTSGHTQTVSSLESGEFDATPTAYGYMAAQEKGAGKAIDFTNPSPLFVSLNPVGLAKNAPHQSAARVFLNWLVSKDGQQFIAQRGGGEISSRTDVKNNPAIWDPKHPYIVISTPTASQYADLARHFRSLLGLPG